MLKNPRNLSILILALVSFAVHNYLLNGLRGSAADVDTAVTAADTAEATALNVLQPPPLLGLQAPEELLPRLPLVPALTADGVRLPTSERNRQAVNQMLEDWMNEHPELRADLAKAPIPQNSVDNDSQIVEGVENLAVVLSYEGISLGELDELGRWLRGHPATWLKSLSFEQVGVVDDGSGAPTETVTSDELEPPPAMTVETVGKATASVVFRYLLPDDNVDEPSDGEPDANP